MGACSHERSHIVDSRFYGHRYSTEATHRIFCDNDRFQRWLDVEAALALSQAELGIIPSDAAEAIVAAAHIDHIDLDAVRADIRRTGHSLVALLRALQAAAGGAGEYVHYGATTQDIQDTAQSLEMRDVLDELDAVLRTILGQLLSVAEQHATTVVVGRTHAQPALPLSFGLKVASWIDEILRHADRLAAMRRRALVVQLFGGVGTMAGFGQQGIALLERFADRLGLSAPAVGWHVARDRVVEYVSGVAMVAGTMARVADEIRTLSRPEFGEVEEAWRHGMVGSSTMPHKRNPEGCEQTVVMARLAAAQVPIALAAMGGEHERDSRSLRVEWVCVPDVSHYTLAACEIVRHITSGLTIHVDRMLANVLDVRDDLATENLMLALAPALGKQTAHEAVYELSQSARDQHRSLREVLREDGDVVQHLDEDDLERIFDPSTYIGESAELTHRVIAQAREWLGNGAPSRVVPSDRT